MKKPHRPGGAMRKLASCEKKNAANKKCYPVKKILVAVEIVLEFDQFIPLEFGVVEGT